MGLTQSESKKVKVRSLTDQNRVEYGFKVDLRIILTSFSRRLLG